MGGKFVILSESAIDSLIGGKQTKESPLGKGIRGIFEREICLGIIGYSTGKEHKDEYCAIIDLDGLMSLKAPLDVVLTRIARVLKSAARPPVHLPRSWSEFHYKNRLSFFATGEVDGVQRWLAEIDGSNRVVKFLAVTDARYRINLADWSPSTVPDCASDYREWCSSLGSAFHGEELAHSFSEQVDLKAIGSDAVVQGYSYDSWLGKLTPEQQKVVDSSLNSSIRVIGPAGSGKTLTLCMRAIRISREAEVSGGRKKILVVTHSWAMAERIDGIIRALSDGTPADSISVMPLLYILQSHAGAIGQAASSVLGEDSAEGQKRVFELLNRIISDSRSLSIKRSSISPHIIKGMDAESGSHARNDLLVDLYEEIIGVLSPQGLLPDDGERITDYLVEPRDETMPPFNTKADRELCLRVFERLVEQLVDLGAITTDQLVLDCIKVFETFTWNVKRETEGYDFILIDELQLFDSQERLAVSLLSRSKPGMLFLSVEDPSQGMFSVINERSIALRSKEQIYLREAHRFRAGLFEFIDFLYGKFPLNAAAIKIAQSEGRSRKKPRLTQLGNADIVEWCVARVREVAESKEKDKRICVICLGSFEDEVSAAIEESGLSVICLKSFDDVDLLSYQRRAAVVSSWQFVGGTQFSDVILIASGLGRPLNAHAKLRELTGIYLGASRASSSLDILYDNRLPEVLQAAVKEKLLIKSVHKADGAT